jgi:hypothetical protein
VVPIGTITILPGTSEKNGRQEKSEHWNPVIRCLSETDNVRGDVLCSNGIEAVAVNGEMIKPIFKAA